VLKVWSYVVLRLEILMIRRSFRAKKNGKILANSEVLCIPLKPGVKSDVGKVGFWFVIIILLEFA
jgi:hypothetical protein